MTELIRACRCAQKYATTLLWTLDGPSMDVTPFINLVPAVNVIPSETITPDVNIKTNMNAPNGNRLSILRDARCYIKPWPGFKTQY